MKNKFKLYEIVIISSNRPVLKAVNGCKGYISAIVKNEESNLWSYAVSVYKDEGYLWSVNENELYNTGQKANPEDYQPVDTIKVRVDPKTGEGEIVEDDED